MQPTIITLCHCSDDILAQGVLVLLATCPHWLSHSIPEHFFWLLVMCHPCINPSHLSAVLRDMCIYHFHFFSKGNWSLKEMSILPRDTAPMWWNQNSTFMAWVWLRAQGTYCALLSPALCLWPRCETEWQKFLTTVLGWLLKISCHNLWREESQFLFMPSLYCWVVDDRIIQVRDGEEPGVRSPGSVLIRNRCALL